MELKEKTEYYSLLATIIFSAIITILDFTDSLDNIVWLKDRISTITLLLLTLITASFLFSTQNTRKFLRSVLPWGTIKKFESSNDTFNYIVERIKKANKAVCDLTFPYNTASPMTYSEDEYEEYLSTIEEVSKRIPYRELVFYYANSNTKKARRLISKAGKYYQLSGYIDQPPDSPLIPVFVIVDDEVIFIDGLAIKQPDIVKYFQNYYNISFGQIELL
jgi:hypothetical protein